MRGINGPAWSLSSQTPSWSPTLQENTGRPRRRRRFQMIRRMGPFSNAAIIPASGARGGASLPARCFGEKKVPDPFSTASSRLIVIAVNLASSLEPKSPPSVRMTVMLSSSSLKPDTWRVGLNGAKSSHNNLHLERPGHTRTRCQRPPPDGTWRVSEDS